LSAYISQGIGFFFMQNLILIPFVGLLSSYAGFIAIGQDSPAAILSLAVMSLLALIPMSGRRGMTALVAALVCAAALALGAAAL
jgi:hypothetical protein